MAAVIRNRWRHWVNRRIARADSHRFDRRSIFILPAGAGLVFGVLLLVMLITGINYQNSLIYLLTFLLGTVFVAAMHQTHNNLAGLELTLVQPGEGFAGDDIPFLLRATADHDVSRVFLFAPGGRRAEVSMPAGTSADTTLMVPARHRGYLALDRVRVETRFPFGLLRAWSWLRPRSMALVYPRPLTPPPVPVDPEGVEETQADSRHAGQDDIHLRPWREGDMSQRVLWKRFARTGELVMAEWEGPRGSPQWLDYDMFPGADRELRLSYLAALVLQRDQAGDAFGLRLPGWSLAPDQGSLHRRQCLRALAVHGLEAQPA